MLPGPYPKTPLFSESQMKSDLPYFTLQACFNSKSSERFPSRPCLPNSRPSCHPRAWIDSRRYVQDLRLYTALLTRTDTFDREPGELGSDCHSAVDVLCDAGQVHGCLWASFPDWSPCGMNEVFPRGWSYDRLESSSWLR